MKKIVSLLLITVLLLSLTACSGSNETANDKTVESSVEELGTITLGVLPDIDSIPFIIALEKGFFEQEGLPVKIVYFKSPVDRDSALQSGNLDGAISDVLAEAFAKDNDFQLRITSMTNGSYKLLVNKDANINDIEGLKGKDVSISKNTIIEYTTDRMLEEAAMTPEDINKVIIAQIPVRLEMLQSGQIQAATLPEPLATTAILGGAKLLNSSDNLGINPGVLLMTGQAIKEKSKEIEAMYRAYNKAVEYLNTEPLDIYIDILIAKVGFPETVRESIELPRYTYAALPSEKDVNDVVQWLYEKELIKNKYSFEELVDHQFIR